MQSFVCIKYPGYIKSVDRVLESLGGINSIQNCVASKGSENSALTLRYNNNDYNTIPLEAKLSSNNGVILKLCKHRQTGETRIYVVGITSKIYEFHNIFDFQLPTPKAIRSVVESNFGAETLNRFQKLHFVPLKLSLLDQPHEFTLSRRQKTDETFNTTEAKNLTPNIRKIPKPNEINHVNYISDTVPSETQHHKLNIPSIYKIPKEEWEKLNKLFRDRKICSKLYIENNLRIPKETLNKVLHFLAFYWLDGPWARLWNVNGYDPRIDSDAAILQTYDHRYFNKTRPTIKMISSAKPNEKTKSHLILNFENTKAGIYQLIDIQQPDAKEFILKSLKQKRKKCDATNGWFENNFYKEFRKLFT